MTERKSSRDVHARLKTGKVPIVSIGLPPESPVQTGLLEQNGYIYIVFTVRAIKYCYHRIGDGREYMDQPLVRN